MVIERAVTFDCGHEVLVGVVHDPAPPVADAGILIVVGGPQYRVGSHRQFVLMARRFAGAGHAVFRFDSRGMGDSSGSARTFESIRDDIESAVARFFIEVPSIRRVIVFGLCDGASAALLFCVSNPRVSGLILANPWVHTESGGATVRLRSYYAKRLLQGTFWAKLSLGRVSLQESSRALLSEWMASRSSGGTQESAGPGDFVSRMRNGMCRFGGSVLIVLSEHDFTADEFRLLIDAIA